MEDIIDFSVWYSGMSREKVINAYVRYLREMIEINNTPTEDDEDENIYDAIASYRIGRELSKKLIDAEALHISKPSHFATECGVCWGGGKIDISDDMETVKCHHCGGTGNVENTVRPNNGGATQ